MRKSNYDKTPSTQVDGTLFKGWDKIIGELGRQIAVKKHDSTCRIVVECYQGVHHDELRDNFRRIAHDTFIDIAEVFKTSDEVSAMTHHIVTDDRLFGYRTTLSYNDFFDTAKFEAKRAKLAAARGVVLVYGHGAAVLCPDADILVYADMPRWEIQMRFRRKEICGLGVDNRDEAPSLHYKRGYFLDWNVCDSLKKRIFGSVDYWLDSTKRGNPKMITGDTMKAGLDKTAVKPFRVVPFFDPAPWGGQWMKEVCDLDRSKQNFGWCFDCVPEENSLNLCVGGELFEMPANNLVFHNSREVLGGPVEARFGQDFPIRFDFLDTMGGGNLSLQVHPTTQYIRDTFGVWYTQDESYYLLDAEEGATVYLGLKTGVDSEKMIDELNLSQITGKEFDAEKYVNKWPAKKHDHYLIPAGTIHCSGAGAMVLEISATPNLFTFKLWDWGRLGLDGRPRPINIKHGSNVIQWERQTEFVRKNLVNHFTKLDSGDGWQAERTGLHENEFIETHRHFFTKPVLHNTGDGVNVLNVIEGDELIVESPENKFEPFVVHYAETFIVPAAVGDYVIRPHGTSEGKRCGTIKAYVRFKN